MNVRRLMSGMLVAAALGFAVAPAVAFAQEHAAGEHAAGEHAAGEHAAGEQGAHEGAEHGGEHHEHGPGPVNWIAFGHHDSEGRTQPPLLASVINFLILMGILLFAVKRMVNPALAERRRAIEAEINEAQRLRTEAEALHREYTERLENVQTEVDGIKADFLKAGEAEYARIIDEARQRAERMGQDAEVAIRQELKQIRDDVMREAAQSATASAEKTLRAQISPQDQTRLAEQYLAVIEKSQGASA
ncbi:MAG: ATP synthase F0 subunit B [Deltaproteobacteria bacterium]